MDKREHNRQYLRAIRTGSPLVRKTALALAKQLFGPKPISVSRFHKRGRPIEFCIFRDEGTPENYQPNCLGVGASWEEAIEDAKKESPTASASS